MLCELCSELATHGFSGKPRTRCAIHAHPNMVITTHCLLCDRRACYGPPDKRYKLFCSVHKEDGMLDLRRGICHECNKNATFFYPGECGATHCYYHRKPGMRNIRGCCIHPKCKTTPSYGSLLDKRRTHCAKHKLPGMINLSSPTCLKCDLTANFNFPGESERLYCYGHKESGMINVRAYRKRNRTEEEYNDYQEDKTYIGRKIEIKDEYPNTRNAAKRNCSQMNNNDIGNYVPDDKQQILNDIEQILQDLDDM